MTKIDFHSSVTDKMSHACRLVRKARINSADARVVILLKDKAQIAALDRALWTFSEQDFVPHAAADDALAAQSAVILTDSDACELPHHDILINLSDAMPAHFAQFERVFEIISPDTAEAAAGRERYAYYRERGYQLAHTVMSQA